MTAFFDILRVAHYNISNSIVEKSFFPFPPPY